MIKLVKEWTDDHILCCTVEIDGEHVHLWWCGWEGLAAAMYADDCPRAKADLMALVEEQKKQDAEDEGGGPPMEVEG